jgi:hypothetical protein
VHRLQLPLLSGRKLALISSQRRSNLRLKDKQTSKGNFKANKAESRLVKWNARAILVISSLLGVIALSGCGQPTQRYAVDKKDGVFFSVPYSWHEITTDALNKTESAASASNATAAQRYAAVHWQAAFSPNAAFGPKNVFTLATPTSPLVYGRVRALLPDEVNAVSYNSLRDIVVPLTSWLSGTDTTAPTFEILDDSEDVQKNGRGVHTVYSFQLSGQLPQTIDQTAIVSDDRTTMYVLLIRCTSTCFQKNQSEISKIAKSFTVRGTR